MTFALELEKYQEYGEAKGRAEGLAEGQAKAIKKLMRNMNLTVQQAMQVLDIPASEYEKYLAMI